jgi:hypothetical protein
MRLGVLSPIHPLVSVDVANCAKRAVATIDGLNSPMLDRRRCRAKSGAPISWGSLATCPGIGRLRSDAPSARCLALVNLDHDSLDSFTLHDHIYDW